MKKPRKDPRDAVPLIVVQPKEAKAGVCVCGCCCGYCCNG